MKCLIGRSIGYAHLGECRGYVGNLGYCLKHIEQVIEWERDELQDALREVRDKQERLTLLRAERKALRDETT